MSFGKNADAILVVEDGLTLSATFGAVAGSGGKPPLLHPTHFGAANTLGDGAFSGAQSAER